MRMDLREWKKVLKTFASRANTPQKASTRGKGTEKLSRQNDPLVTSVSPVLVYWVDDNGGKYEG